MPKIDKQNFPDAMMYCTISFNLAVTRNGASHNAEMYKWYLWYSLTFSCDTGASFSWEDSNDCTCSSGIWGSHRRMVAETENYSRTFTLYWCWSSKDSGVCSEVLPELHLYIGYEYVWFHLFLQEFICLTLVINPAYKLDWIQKHWTEKEAQDAREWILEAVCSFTLFKLVY